MFIAIQEDSGKGPTFSGSHSVHGMRHTLRGSGIWHCDSVLCGSLGLTFDLRLGRCLDKRSDLISQTLDRYPKQNSPERL